MTIWNYIISGLSFLLLIFLIGKEVKRRDKTRMAWRVVASALAVTSLAFIAIPVTFTVGKDVETSKQFLLLTDGYKEDSLRAFLKNKSEEYQVCVINADVLNAAKSFEPVFIPDLQMLGHSSEAVQLLHVFGYGLTQEELQQTDLPIVFHPSETPTGIKAVNWQKKLNLGERLFVQGTFQNNFPNDVKVVLRGLQTNLDSVVVPAKTTSSFELTTTPKHLDRAVYHIFATSENDTIEMEEIPVEVTQPRTLQVLILAVSPDFENKFLKNRLSQNGYGVAIRSRISKDKFDKEYLNLDGISLDHISPAVLDKFDAVIADAAELASIPRPELQVIQTAVQNKGLGMIVRADSAMKSSLFFGKDFSLIQGKENNEKTASLFLKSGTGSVVKLPIEHPVYIQSNPGTQTLVYGNSSYIFAGSTIYGNGKIIMSTLENTYSLLLSGNQPDYDEIWSLLLEKAARTYSSEDAVSISPAMPKLNEPFTLSVQSNNQSQSGQMGDEKVYLQQDVQLPFLQRGVYWPKQPGWIPEVTPQGKIHWFYVYKNNDWRTLDAAKRLTATKLYALKAGKKDNKPGMIKKEMPYSVPRVYFFIIFIISSGFLWFEKKLIPQTLKRA